MSIRPEKASSRRSGLAALFQWEPSSEPPTPARPKTRPAPKRTRPARQWGAIPMMAVMATRTSDVVVACFGVWPAA